MRRYILIGQTPVPEPNLEKWAEWFGSSGDARVVCQSEIGASLISTVFLGLDHQFGVGLPILFETMIFAGNFSDLYQDRCGTWQEAVEMHADAVEQARRWQRQLPVVLYDRFLLEQSENICYITPTR
jgi:hypothetical protein